MSRMRRRKRQWCQRQSLEAPLTVESQVVVDFVSRIWLTLVPCCWVRLAPVEPTQIMPLGPSTSAPLHVMTPFNNNRVMRLNLSHCKDTGAQYPPSVREATAIRGLQYLQALVL